MEERFYIREHDRTTAGGIVLDGITDTENAEQKRLSHLYATIRCPACNSDGFIAPWGDRPDDEIDGKQPALHMDICKCQCEPPPRLLASDRSMSVWV
ncbi:MAG TPA: PAAR domain-containing protein [Paraburkholderia sp.]